MSEQPVGPHAPQPERPGDEDIIATLMEEIQGLNDQRLFFKSQVRSYQRRAEHAEMAQASLQARVDQLEAEAGSDTEKQDADKS